MRKLVTALFSPLALTVLLVSCNNTDEEPAPVAEKECLLTTFTLTDVPDQPVRLFYDDNRRLTRLEVEEEIYDGLDNTIITFEYNANNQIKRANYAPKSNPTVMEGYVDYEYNADGLLTQKKSFYVDDTDQSIQPDLITAYEYNANRQVVKISYLDGKDNSVLDYTLFTYDANGNVQKEEYYNDNSGDGLLFLQGISTYEYDDKPNARGLVISYISDDGDDAVTLSRNNIVKLTYQDASQPQQAGDTYTYQYEYNDKGMATRVESSFGSVFTMGYQCD